MEQDTSIDILVQPRSISASSNSRENIKGSHEDKKNGKNNYRNWIPFYQNNPFGNWFSSIFSVLVLIWFFFVIFISISIIYDSDVFGVQVVSSDGWIEWTSLLNNFLFMKDFSYKNYSETPSFIQPSFNHNSKSIFHMNSPPSSIS